MASSILAPSAPVSKTIIEDLIFQVDAALEMQPRAFSRVFNALCPTINEVAHACQRPSMLNDVISEQRRQANTAGTTCGQAFDLFIENMNAAG